MERLTADNPQDNIQTALNLFYIKDGWTWVMGGGPAPEYHDVSLCDYVRSMVKAHIPDADIPGDDIEMSCLMAEWLFDGTDTVEGLTATLYTAGWAFAELRHRLKAYEDTGLEPEEFRAYWSFLEDLIGNQKASEVLVYFRELVKADKDGRLVVLNEPRRPLVWPDKTHNVVLCPNCNHDLMGGFELSDTWMMFQCPYCGQPIDANRATYAEQTEAALEGGGSDG